MFVIEKNGELLFPFLDFLMLLMLMLNLLMISGGGKLTLM